MSVGFLLEIACFKDEEQMAGCFPTVQITSYCVQPMMTLSPFSGSKTELGFELSPSPGSRNTTQMEKTGAILLFGGKSWFSRFPLGSNFFLSFRRREDL